MLDILDVINEATKEANSFENHAAKDLTLEERLLYLQGLALVMNADGEIHPEEKEYIRILIKSFEMDESILDSFVEFAQRPDKDTVQEFFRTFKRRPIAQLFLFDALMMTRRDDSVDDRETAVVDKIAEQLEVRKGVYHDIFYLFCHIKNKDWDESVLYFSYHLLNANYFSHILDYYEIKLDELIERTDELRRDFIFRKLRGKLSLKINENNASVELTSSVVTPMLQAMIDRGEVRILGDRVIFGNNEELELSTIGLKYNPERKYLQISEEKSFSYTTLTNKFFKKLTITNNSDFCTLFSIESDRIIFGTLDSESDLIINLNKEVRENSLLLYNGKLWNCEQGKKYDFIGKDKLYNLTNDFVKKEEVKRIILHYGNNDNDVRGYLNQISLW